MDTQNKKQRFSYTHHDMLTLCTDEATSPENQSTVDLIPDYKSDILRVKSMVDETNLLIVPIRENTTGTAKQKRNLKFDLAEKIFAVSSPFAAFAYGKNDMELYHSFSKTIWNYREMRPAALISNAGSVIETVSKYLPQLTGTSISQNSLDAIKNARDSFAPYAAAPRSKVVSKHDKLVQAVALQKKSMDIITHILDRQMIGFVTLGKESYYNQWIRARKLVPYGTLTTRASVDVFMGDSNAPVPNALVKISNTPLKGTTNAKGHTTISRVPFKEEQFITVIAPGFETPVTAGPFIFKKGKATHIVINMNQFKIPEPSGKDSNVNV
jgi:hypothetical protein